MPPITIKSGGALNFKRAFFFPGKIISPAGGSPFTNEYSVDFDGTNDYAVTAYSPGASSGFTASMWLKTSDTTSNITFWSNGDAGALGGFQVLSPIGTGARRKSFYVLVKDSSGSTWYELGVGGDHSTLDIRDGQWHHLAVTIDGTSVKIYKDGGDAAGSGNTQGTPFASATSSVSYTGNTGNPYILGRNGTYSSYYYDGLQDEVAFFETALSGSDISAIYNSGVPADLTSYSPAAWWRMGDGVENGSGTTIYDATSYSTRSVDFDGSNDQCDLGDLTVLSGATKATFSIWYNKDTSTSFANAFGSGTLSPLNYLGLDIRSAEIRFYCVSDGSYVLTATQAQHIGAWHHVVGVYDASATNKLTLYYDGASIATSTSGPTSLNAYSIADGGIGVFLNNSWFPGMLDEAAIWDSALSASDVTAIYNNGAPADLTSLGPVGWWRMGDGTEDGSGTTIYDMSSNSNNGTLTNGPTYSHTSPSANNATLTNGPTFSTNTPYPRYSTKSVDFDGTDDYFAAIPDSDTNVETFSIWFKSPNSFASDGFYGDAAVLFGWGNQSNAWGLAVGGGMIGAMDSSLVYVRHTNNGAYGYTPGSVTTLAADTWHHIATRWSTSSETNSGSNGYDIWVNGTKITGSEATSNGTMSTTPEQISTNKFTLAKRSSLNVTYTYEGLIDEVAIWSSALSEADVTALYNSGTPSDLTDLSPTHWYRMGDNDGGTGTTITDQGSGENDGTLTNGPTHSTDTP